MKAKIITAMLASLFTVSVLAVTAEINVTANIDSTLEIRNADGTPLDKNVSMSYTPGTGLDPFTTMTKIYSNDTTKGVTVRVASAPFMVHTTKPSAATIPLKVSYLGKELSTTVVTLTAAELFTGSGSDASVPAALTIEQATRAAVTESGVYQGIVSIVFAQGA